MRSGGALEKRAFSALKTVIGVLYFVIRLSVEEFDHQTGAAVHRCDFDERFFAVDVKVLVFDDGVALERGVVEGARRERAGRLRDEQAMTALSRQSLRQADHLLTQSAPAV